jgi:hypothetical protein
MSELIVVAFDDMNKAPPPEGTRTAAEHAGRNFNGPV